MGMKRRTLLTTLAGGTVAGLGGHLLAGAADEDLQRRVSLASQDAVPDDYEITIDVEVVESTVTNLRPARVRITTTNEGPKRAISIRGKVGCVLFNRENGGSDEPPGLWLHEPTYANNINREDNQWVRASSDRPRGFPLHGCRPKTYEAGESLSNEYVVWHDYRVDGYLDPGTYRWEEDVSIWEGEYDAHEDSSKNSVTTTWGFSLTVEQPD